MKETKTTRRQHGFTMVELMAVLIIIGLLFGVVAKNVVGRIDQARVTATKANLKTLHQAVLSFKMEQGRYPDETLGLQELLEQPSDAMTWPPGGYLETTDIPLDEWDNEFQYELDPESGKDFVIYSFGADRERGGDDYDADLLSTDAN